MFLDALSRQARRDEGRGGLRRPARAQRPREPRRASRGRCSFQPPPQSTAGNVISTPAASCRSSPARPCRPRSRRAPRRTRSSCQRRPLGDRPSAHGGRTADRLLLPRSRARDGSARTGHPRTGLDLGAVPRLHPHRAHRGLRVVAHVGRPRHHRHVRRDAVRRQRHQVRVPRPVPRHGALRRRHAQRRHRRQLLPDGPRPGRRLRDGQRAHASRCHASARATAATSSTSCSTATSRSARSTTSKTSSTPRTRRPRRSTPSTSTTVTSGCSRAVTSRSGRPTSTPDSRSTDAASTSGAAPSTSPPAPAGHQPAERRDRQLEQPGDRRVPGVRRQLGARRDPARRAAHRQPRPTAKQTLASVDRGDERGRHPRRARSCCCGRCSRRCCGDAPGPARAAARAICSTRGTTKAAAGSTATLDGKIDDPGAAIMDAAWQRLANAWAEPVLGPLTADLADDRTATFDAPPGGQYGGWHVYMDKDLRSLLGEPVKGTFRRRFCGAGDLDACRNIAVGGARPRRPTSSRRRRAPIPTAWRADATANGSSSSPACSRRRCATPTARAASSR